MKIEELLSDIQKRPKMFVREINIEYICYFLLGYCCANSELSEDDIDRKFCAWFGRWLIMWIEDNVDKDYNPKTAWWFEDIRWLTKSGQDEVAVFFELCKFFFEDYNNKVGYFSWRNK